MINPNDHVQFDGRRFSMLYHDVEDAIGNDGTAMLLYLRLCRYAGNESKEAYPSRKRLAKDLGKSSERTIDTALTKLEEAGVITIIPRWIDSEGVVSFVKSDRFKSRTSNIYVVHDRVVTPAEREQLALPSVENSATPSVENSATPSVENCAGTNTHNNLNPNELTQEGLPLSFDDSTVTPEMLFEDQFNEFWEKYPRHDVTKANCQKSLKRALKKVDFDELMVSVSNYRDKHRQAKTEKRYIKLPTTWLNQGEWELYRHADSTNEQATAGSGNSSGSRLDRLSRFK